MNLYQIKLDMYEGYTDSNEIYPSYLLTHKDKLTQEKLQYYVNLAKMDMEHYPSFKDLPGYMERYGFEQVITAYFE